MVLHQSFRKNGELRRLQRMQKLRNVICRLQRCWIIFPVDFPDVIQNLNNLEVRYVTGEVERADLQDYIDNTYAPATADIAEEFAQFMAENPVRYEK